MTIAPGATSVSLTVFIADDIGQGVTGLLAATFPTVYYAREREAAASITLADLALITTAYTSGGVKEYSGGYYRLDVPNAAWATASRVVVFGETTGKHLSVPGGSIFCGNPAVDTVLLNGAAFTVESDPATNEDVISGVAQALAGTVNVNVNSPITAGTMELMRGDAYDSDDGTEIIVLKTANDVAAWPDTLTTVHFRMEVDADFLTNHPTAFAGFTGVNDIACTVDDATGDDQAFTLELTAAQTVQLTAGANNYNFWFVANKAGNPKTLRRGTVTVVADYTA